MAETMTAPPKPKAAPSGHADKAAFDKAALAQVEKWMAIIREVCGEQPRN